MDNIKEIRDLLYSKWKIKCSKKWVKRYLYYISKTVPQIQKLSLKEAEERFNDYDNIDQLAFFIMGMRLDWNLRTFGEKRVKEKAGVLIDGEEYKIVEEIDIKGYSKVL